jgi:hypothetical protein
MIKRRFSTKALLVVPALLFFSQLYAGSQPKSVILADIAEVAVVNSPTVVQAKPSDQMVCIAAGSWLLAGTAFPCVQASMPGQQNKHTLAELFADGWVIQSIGNGGASNRVAVAFHK